MTVLAHVAHGASSIVAIVIPAIVAGVVARLVTRER